MNEKNNEKNGKKLLFSCFYAFFFCGIITLTLGSALPDIRTANNLPYSMTGLLLSCYSLGNLASGLLSGIISGYIGQKKSVVLLSLSICFGIFVLAFTGIKFFLFLACSLIGLGRGSLITFSQRTINLLTNGKPSITGLLHSAFAFGAILSPIIFSCLRIISWKAGLYCILAIGLSVAVIFICLSEYPENKTQSVKSLEFLHDKKFLILSFMMFLYLCSEFAVNGWLVTYMTHKNTTMNFSQSMAALMWVVMLIGRISCAIASKYFDSRKILMILSVGSALFFGFMLKSEGKIFISFNVAMTGLCMSGISPIIYASSAGFTNKYPLAMGTLYTIGCLGGTLMPFITGVMVENIGFDAGMSMILSGLVMLVIFAMMFLNLKHKEA